MSPKVVEYKYENAFDQASRLGVAHIVFLFVLIPWIADIGLDGEWRLLICTISGIIAFSAFKILNIRETSNIAVLVALYYVLFGLEMVLFGVPNELLNNDRQISKGIMLEVLVASFPAVYVGLRLAMGMIYLPCLLYTSDAADD